MPRRARLVIPDVPVHLIQRGHNRRACFFEERDFEYYLHWLGQFAREFECEVHAYALMSNHVHMAITAHATDALAQLMKKINQKYVAFINKKLGRTGTLWEGRCKTCLLLDVKYFLTCMRYIELNPVRANMVQHPRDYPWSSYRANADGAYNPCIKPHPTYLALGSTEADRQLAYRIYVGTDPADYDCIIQQLRAATCGNCVLGEESAVAELVDALGRRITPGKRGRPFKQIK